MLKIGRCPESGKHLEPEDIYIDYWLWKKWTREVTTKLTESSRERLPIVAKNYVAAYSEFGTSIPNPMMAEAIDLADRQMFRKLNQFRYKDDGDSALRLKRGKRNVDGILEAFSDVLKDKEKNAVIRGLKRAYKMIFSAEPADADEPEKVEGKISIGLQEIIWSATSNAWKSVWGILSPGQKLETDEPKKIEKEVRLNISRRITRGVNSALRALVQGEQDDTVDQLHELPVAADALDDDIGVAVGELKRVADQSALKSVLEMIKGGKEPTHEEMDGEELRAEIEKEIKPVLDGLEIATSTLVKGIIGSREAESASDPIQAAKERFQQLKKLEKHIEPLMKDLRRDPHILCLTQEGKTAFRELVTFVESIPKPTKIDLLGTDTKRAKSTPEKEKESEPPKL